MGSFIAIPDFQSRSIARIDEFSSIDPLRRASFIPGTCYRQS